MLTSPLESVRRNRARSFLVTLLCAATDGVSRRGYRPRSWTRFREMFAVDRMEEVELRWEEVSGALTLSCPYTTISRRCPEERSLPFPTDTSSSLFSLRRFLHPPSAFPSARYPSQE